MAVAAEPPRAIPGPTWASAGGQMSSALLAAALGFTLRHRAKPLVSPFQFSGIAGRRQTDKPGCRNVASCWDGSASLMSMASQTSSTRMPKFKLPTPIRTTSPS